MKILHKADENCFAAYNDEGEEMGVIEYTPSGTGEIYATSTEVYPQFEGHGVAGNLLDALVEYARQGDRKIVPICTYVIGAFQRHPEKYGDVIK